MNRNDPAYLFLEPKTMSNEDVVLAKASYFLEARKNVTATFFIISMLATGAVVIFFKLFWPFRFDSVVALGIGSIIGALGAVSLLIFGFRDYFQFRADLLIGKCEILDVCATQAFNVNLDEKFPAVALDCGERTLVFSGNWWEDLNRKEIWKNARERMSFPASSFILRRLPQSGRVLSVVVKGKKLKIQENDPIEPLLRVDRPDFVEVFYIDDRIENLLTWRGQFKKETESGLNGTVES